MDYEKYINICKRLIRDYGLQKNSRTGIVTGGNVGDNYFMLSALPYVKRKLSRDFVIFAHKGAPIHKMGELFNRGGANLEIVPTEEDLSALFPLNRPEAIKFLDGIIERHLYQCALPDIYAYLAPQDVKQNLARPSYPPVSNSLLEKKYHIEPGKTILVIPDAVWHGTLPPYFWQTVLNLYQALGLKLIINRRQPLPVSIEAEYIFPPFEELKPIADLCGYVFAIRTGIAETLAAESSARVVLVNHAGPIQSFYPFIIQDKICNYPIESIRSSGFPAIDSHISSLLSERIPTAAYSKLYLEQNIDSAPIITPHCYSDKFRGEINFFEERPKYYINTKMPIIKYQLLINKDNVIIKLLINPPHDYEIHGALIDIKKNAVAGEIKFAHYNPLVFIVTNSSDYKVFIKLIHPASRAYYHFTTETMSINVDRGTVLAACTNYELYISLLEQYREDLLIFISSKDTHTGWEHQHKLFLERLGLHGHPDQHFRWSFLAIIDGGNVVEEQESENQTLQASYTWDHNKAILTSSGWNTAKSNLVNISIRINQKEEALNMRGLNFLIWDKRYNKVIDSVAFDTFIDRAPAYRFNHLYQ